MHLARVQELTNSTKNPVLTESEFPFSMYSTTLQEWKHTKTRDNLLLWIRRLFILSMYTYKSIVTFCSNRDRYVHGPDFRKPIIQGVFSHVVASFISLLDNYIITSIIEGATACGEALEWNIFSHYLRIFEIKPFRVPYNQLNT